MIRHCDGTDPNLQRADGEPCDCGATFDDVNHRVIYPHEEFAKLNEQELTNILRWSETPAPPRPV